MENTTDIQTDENIHSTVEKDGDGHSDHHDGDRDGDQDGHVDRHSDGDRDTEEVHPTTDATVMGRLKSAEADFHTAEVQHWTALQTSIVKQV